MKPSCTLHRVLRNARLGLVYGLGLLVVACGGVDVNGTGAPLAYSQGSITGFGSVIVNDIHFDESTASVLADDGSTPLQAGDLKLGMSVEVDSGAIDTLAGTATASVVRLHSSLVGGVVNPNVTAGTFSVVGQTVQVTSATVFDAAFTGGLAGVAAGSLVEVHAVYDPVSGVYSARRIDPAAGAALFRVRGLVTALDTVAKTFQIGNAVFVYTSATPPAGVATGALVRVQVQPAPDASGRWVVSDAAKGERLPMDGVHTGLVGVVSSFTTPSSNFVVDGVQVNAATVTPAGGVLKSGAWVKLEGVMTAGVLVAGKVEVKIADMNHGGPGSGGFDMQLRGKLASLDTGAKTFKVRDAKTAMLREVLVEYASASYPSGGSAADLKTDALVEVTGKLSADGHDVVASQIKFVN